MRIQHALLCLFAVAMSPAAWAGPKVAVVVGQQAPPLERMAADELAAQLKLVYQADVSIADKSGADAPHVIFVGSPATNPQLEAFKIEWTVGGKALSAQGHLLRTVTFNKRPALMIGGGSPAATYWAVAEFGHRLGIRSLLFGDLEPVNPPEFGLADINIALEPELPIRGWSFANDLPLDTACWGLTEYQAVLKQLAKLKFNHVALHVGPALSLVNADVTSGQQPPIPGGGPWPVGGDTSGRKVFHGERLFGNPDFLAAKSAEEKMAARKAFLKGFLTSAEELGMTVGLQVEVSGTSEEMLTAFAALAPEGGLFELELVLPRPAASAETTPPKGTEKLEDRLLSQQLAISQKLQQKFPALKLKYRTESGLLAAVSQAGDEKQLGAIFSPLREAGAVLPPAAISDAWGAELLKACAAPGCAGFIADTSSVYLGDQDAFAYWLSRVSFDKTITPQAATKDLVTAVCDEGVFGRIWKAFELISQSEAAVLNSMSGLPACSDSTFLARVAAFEPSKPGAWDAVRDGYLNAMNEMYRANTRAREGGRDYSLYFARRYEFAYEYTNFLEAVHNAQLAENEKDKEKQGAELEKAIESLNNALNALAAVARSNSDRGAIAMLNEFAYRPLKEKLITLEDEAE